MKLRLLAVSLVLFMVPQAAVADPTIDDFALSGYEPTYAGDRFLVTPDATVEGASQFAAKLSGNYGYKPLHLIYEGSGKEIPGGLLIRDQLYLHLDLSYSLANRVRFDVGVPLIAYQYGESSIIPIASFNNWRLGDVRAGLRINLFGSERDPFALGVQADVWLPTGYHNNFATDGKVRGRPQLVASGLFGERFAYALAVGSMIRSHRETQHYRIGSAATYAASFGVLLAEGLVQLGPEAYGNTVFKSGDTAVEALMGAKICVHSGLTMGAGAGGALVHAPGAAVFRAVANVAWEPGRSCRPPDGDRDHDGILDSVDACPDIAGVGSDDPKLNGCPPPLAPVPPDRDGDGIIDADDACPDTPGVKSDDPKLNGCPPVKADRDNDGIIDELDACSDTPGVNSDDPKLNGCPPPAPPDRDGDGIIDADDACPDTPGVKSDDLRKNGCPALAEQRSDAIVILQQIQFELNQAEIKPESDDVLQAVAQILQSQPAITSLRIEGHTDNYGTRAWNLELSKRRAQAVHDWLVEKGGIDSGRLSIHGFGPDQPIAPNRDRAGRQKNRRVEFRILSGP